jgi:hypothetical protein
MPTLLKKELSFSYSPPQSVSMERIFYQTVVQQELEIHEIFGRPRI